MPGFWVLGQIFIDDVICSKSGKFLEEGTELSSFSDTGFKVLLKSQFSDLQVLSNVLGEQSLDSARAQLINSDKMRIWSRLGIYLVRQITDLPEHVQILSALPKQRDRKDLIELLLILPRPELGAIFS